MKALKLILLSGFLIAGLNASADDATCPYATPGHENRLDKYTNKDNVDKMLNASLNRTTTVNQTREIRNNSGVTHN